MTRPDAPPGTEDGDGRGDEPAEDGPHPVPPVAGAVQALWKACAATAGAVRALQRPTGRGALGSVAYLVDEGGEEALRPNASIVEIS